MTARPVPPPAESFADQAFAVATNACSGEPDSWELGIQAAIEALFDFLASQPDRTTACIVSDCGAGPEALARRDAAIDCFVGLLRPGFGAIRVPPPPVVAEAIGGGIYELVRSHVLERRLDELPQAAPNATVLALSPFMGANEAIALASAAPARTSR